MSAWSKSIEAAPRDGSQILMRSEEWLCPAVMVWDTTYNEWRFAEEALQDIDGSLVGDLADIEWAPLPS
jgi:hypothetical protein